MIGAPRILLLGATGQVGRELSRVLPAIGDVASPTRAELDLTQLARVHDFIRDSRPNVIVNAAAYAAVDPAEDEPELAFALNAALPRALAEASARLGALLVHYSTDYVFDGTKRTPYLESDQPNPINTYGVTKLAGETAIAEVAAPHVILRTSWVYGSSGQSLYSKVRQLNRAAQELRVVTDQTGSPTWSRGLAVASEALVRQLINGQHSQPASEVTGIYHLAGKGETTRYDFARAIVALEHGDAATHRIVPVTSEEFAARALRPKYSVLDTAKVARQFGITMPFWRDDLARLLGSVDNSA